MSFVPEIKFKDKDVPPKRMALQAERTFYFQPIFKDIDWYVPSRKIRCLENCTEYCDINKCMRLSTVSQFSLFLSEDNEKPELGFQWMDKKLMLAAFIESIDLDRIQEDADRMTMTSLNTWHD